MNKDIKLRVRKANNGKWMWELELPPISGKRNRKTKSGFNTKNEARTDGSKVKKEYEDNPNYMMDSDMTFSQLLDVWFNDYCLINLKESTYVGYKKKMPRLKKELGAIKVRNITTQNVQLFINELAIEKISRNSLSVYKGMITNSLNFAIATLNIINRNVAKMANLPAKRGEVAQRANKHPHSLLTEQEMVKILRRFPEGSSVHIPLVLCYRLGLRRGEAFGIIWDDIDFLNKTISIRRQLQYSEVRKVWYCTAPKYNSERTIPLDDKTLDLLKRAKKVQFENRAKYKDRYYEYYFDSEQNILIDGDKQKTKPAHFVNVRENGEIITTNICEHTTQRIHKDLGIEKFTMHSLRHTNATVLIQFGADIKTVQLRLGHKNIEETLNIYAHCSKEMEDNTVCIANSVF